MDAQEILSKIKQQDKETFRRLVSEYGKGLYLKLYAASGDQDAARQATKAAFTELYLALNSQQGPDVIESLLYSIGERKQREILQEQTLKMASECLDRVVELSVPYTVRKVKAEASMAVPPVLEDEAAAGQSEPQPAGDIPVEVQQEKTASRMGFWQVVFALLVIAGLWVAIGALMGDGYLPQYDLGYRWFNMNIANWFTWL